MNRNISEISIISKIICKIKTDDDISMFFKELLTNSEIEILSKRWRILQMLANGKTQRTIANELKVSLCKVTRGAKILKNKNSILAKYLKENL